MRFQAFILLLSLRMLGQKMFGMRVVGVQGLLDISMIRSWSMLILCLGGCITTPLLWVLLTTWYGWELRMEFFLFNLITSL